MLHEETTVIAGVVSILGVSGDVEDGLAGDFGGTVVSAGGGIGGMTLSARSSVMDLLSAGWWTGIYFLRNFLFLSVCLPEPSILMRYWWNWRTSMTMPVLSHLLGWLPDWFWIRTLSPTVSGVRALVFSLHFSCWVI
jgi:hypothetical protein